MLARILERWLVVFLEPPHPRGVKSLEVESRREGSESRDGHTFGTCTCEAGTPHKGRRVPQVCKHLAAVVLFLRAIQAMRRHTSH